MALVSGGLKRVVRVFEGVGRYKVVPLDHPKVLSATSEDASFGYIRGLLDADQERMIDELNELKPYYAELEASVEKEQRDAHSPYWHNGFFSDDDARIAYAMVRARRPRRIVEIGCGNSTRFFRKAINDGGLTTRLQCIDPEPRAAIAGVADEIIPTTLQQVDPTFFANLEPQSILFFDGSHLVLPGTDTPYFFMEVLPRLQPGVIVHIHDICLPYEYTHGFSAKGYGEQYMLATLLAHSSSWVTNIPVYYLRKAGALAFGGSSYWMTRSLRAPR